jgi:hypothetical protein
MNVYTSFTALVDSGSDSGMLSPCYHAIGTFQPSLMTSTNGTAYHMACLLEAFHFEHDHHREDCLASKNTYIPHRSRSLKTSLPQHVMTTRLDPRMNVVLNCSNLSRMLDQIPRRMQNIMILAMPPRRPIAQSQPS